MSSRRTIDRHQLLARVEAGGTITPTEMRAVLDALAAAEDAAGVDTIRRGVERLEVIVEQRDALAACLARVLALHPTAIPRVGPAFCPGCGEPAPCPTRQALEGDA